MSDASQFESRHSSFREPALVITALVTACIGFGAGLGIGLHGREAGDNGCMALQTVFYDLTDEAWNAKQAGNLVLANHEAYQVGRMVAANKGCFDAAAVDTWSPFATASPQP